ncbi:hypothetical protein BDR22DRAFT_968160 [Usnea florida]
MTKQKRRDNNPSTEKGNLRVLKKQKNRQESDSLVEEESRILPEKQKSYQESDSLAKEDESHVSKKTQGPSIEISKAGKEGRKEPSLLRKEEYKQNSTKNEKQKEVLSSSKGEKTKMQAKKKHRTSKDKEQLVQPKRQKITSLLRDEEAVTNPKDKQVRRDLLNQVRSKVSKPVQTPPFSPITPIREGQNQLSNQVISMTIRSKNNTEDRDIVSPLATKRPTTSSDSTIIAAATVNELMNQDFPKENKITQSPNIHDVLADITTQAEDFLNLDNQDNRKTTDFTAINEPSSINQLPKLPMRGSKG